METTVRVEGARQLRAALKRAGVELQDLKDANARVSAFVAGLAAGRAPRRTGRLAATIRGNKAASRARVSAGNNGAIKYAGPVHWGWPARGIAPNPFIAETAQTTEHIWVAEYQRDLDRIIGMVEGSTNVG